MREVTIVCGSVVKANHPEGKTIRLDIGPEADPRHRVDFDAHRMLARFADDMPDIVADALVVAAYVYAADRLVTRGPSDSAKISDGWRRRLRFRVAVRRPEIWQRTEIVRALIDVLSFLSGDEFAFEFEQARECLPMEPFLGFHDPNAQVIRPDLVMLFSGGLDSLAGVASEVIGSGKSALLVTHRSSNAVTNRQNELFRQISLRCQPRQVYHAPIRIRRGAEAPIEHSQRLRSFLFATLGLAYAQMFERDRVQFFENGVTSFNLPVADHILGSRASRTTHPPCCLVLLSCFRCFWREPSHSRTPSFGELRPTSSRRLPTMGVRI